MAKGKCKHEDMRDYPRICLNTDAKCRGYEDCEEYEEIEESDR